MATINKTKYLEFKCTKSPSNNDWYYVKRTNDLNNSDSAVVITTLVKKDNKYNFFFLKTKRPPIYAENKAEFCLESPAGLIGDEISSETLIDCANKELKEEAGLKADKIFIELTNSSTSAGLSSETLTYITAIVNDNILSAKPLDDGGIITERFYIRVSDIYDYLNSVDKKQISVSAPTICGVFFAIKRLEILTNNLQ